MNTQIETAIGKFIWHEHNSTDVGAAKDFYTGIFGWELEVFKPGEVDYTMIKNADRMHGGFSEAQGGAPSHWLAYVWVEDADETAEKAKTASGDVLAEPFDIADVGRITVLADAQGAVFAAIQPSGEADEPPSEGTFVWDELMTTDVAGAKAFYGDVFGWTSYDNEMGDMTYTIFQRGEGTDVGGCMPPPEGVEAPSHWKPYIASDDVDAVAAKASELGGSVLAEPMDIPDVGRFAVIADPTGAAFGILAPISE